MVGWEKVAVLVIQVVVFGYTESVSDKNVINGAVPPAQFVHEVNVTTGPVAGVSVIYRVFLRSDCISPLLAVPVKN